MASKKMGFEGVLYYGTAGSTGATLINNVTDVNMTFDAEFGSTSSRPSSGVLLNTQRVTAFNFSCEFTVLVKPADSTYQALLDAASAGTPLALRAKDYSSGKGPDIDVNLTWKHGQPLKGEQTIVFTATPNDDARSFTSADLYV